MHRITDACLLVLKHDRVPVTQEYVPDLSAPIKDTGKLFGIHPECRSTYLNLAARICLSFPNCCEQAKPPS